MGRAPVEISAENMTDVGKVLREVIAEIVKERRYDDPEIDVEPINSGGANYTSELFVVTIKHDKKEKSLFAKVANVGDSMRKTMNASLLFRSEAFFYTELANVYDRLQEKHAVPPQHRIRFPKFYGLRKKKYEETVVLENLAASGYGPFNRFKSLDWEHAASSVSELTKFHALSFAYRKESPEEFEAVAKDFKFVAPEKTPVLEAVWGKMMSRAADVLEDEHRNRLLVLFKNHMGHLERFNEPRGRPVLIHGDYRASNLMFRRQNDRLETILVDFQTIRSACGVADLLYFILNGTDATFRDKHYEELLQHYYDELDKAMARLGLEIAEEYPKEEYESDIKALLPLALVMCVAVLPMVLVDAELAPRTDGDSNIEGFATANSELFPERFSGIIRDCIKWGVL